MIIKRTEYFTRRAKKILTEDEIFFAEEELIEQPDKWPIIVGTNGVRKARVARGNSGKGKGARIIYYVLLRDKKIYLLDVYTKNQKDNLSEEDKKFFRQVVHNIERGQYETIH